MLILALSSICFCGIGLEHNRVDSKDCDRVVGSIDGAVSNEVSTELLSAFIKGGGAGEEMGVESKSFGDRESTLSIPLS